MRVGGIVLCGGKSTRMGRPKGELPFGNQTILEQVVSVVSSVVDPVVVVAAREQPLPPLPAEVQILRDEDDSLGPLAGIAVGLKYLASHVSAAYCTACDVPLLQSKFVREVCNRQESFEIAAVRQGDRWHPLAAVYRTDLAHRVRQRVDQRQLRLLDLLEASNTVAIPAESLLTVDPELWSLRNMNTPEDYAAIQQYLRSQGL